MNMTDEGKQPIITQMGWFETFDLATNSMKKVLQQMRYPGQDGTPIAKGALRVCKERGLKGIEKMRLDDLRALLASQPDFACVKPEIQLEAERRRHILLFGPKCHLNACMLKCAGHMSSNTVDNIVDRVLLLSKLASDMHCQNST